MKVPVWQTTVGMMLIFGSHTNKKCQTEVNLGGEKKEGWGAGNKGGGQRWADNQSTESSFHTHKFKADGVRACCGGAREKREGGKKDFDFIWQPETPSHSLYQKGREAWSVHCHKINTDTKSKETEIKRVIDVEREKVKKKKGNRKGQNEEKRANANSERGMDAGEER